MSLFRNLLSTIQSTASKAITIATAVYQASVAKFREVVGKFGGDIILDDDAEEIEVRKNTIEFQNGSDLEQYFYEEEFELNLPQQIIDIARELIDTYYEDSVFRAHIKVIYIYGGRELTESTKFVNSPRQIISNVRDLANELLAKYEGVTIVSVVLEVLKIPDNTIAMLGSKYSESLISLPNEGEVLRYDEDYIIYNPVTKTNCLYQSVVACLDPKLIGRGKYSFKDDRLLTKDPLVFKASALKKKAGCTNIVSVGDDIQRVANTCKITILLFDDKMDLIDSFIGGDSETIRLIMHSNHCYAMIKFGTDPNMRPRYCSDKVTKIKPESSRDINFYAADLEAYLNEKSLSVAYSIAYAYYHKGQLVYNEFIGHEDCIDRFFASLTETRSNKTIYFHNGGKYDINVIIQQFLFSDKAKDYTICNKSKVYLNGRYARFVVNKGPIKLTFLDSICLFNMSLEACTGAKGFDVEHKKLTGNIDHRKINEHNYRDIMKNGMEIDGTKGHTGSEYLRNDVVGLLECIDKFGASVWEDCKINITKVISASSISKRIFKQNFIKNEYPIYLLDEASDKFIRKTYHGGRTEAFYKGVYSSEYIEIDGIPCTIGDLYYYDFTSLYPSAAATGDCSLPYGKIHPLNVKTYFNTDRIIGNEMEMEMLENKAVFMLCKVRTIDFKRKPLHCVQVEKTGRLVFPHFNDWTEVYLTGVEIVLGIREKIYEYKPISGFWFKKAPILKDYFTNLFEKKQEASLNGFEAKALCYKIIANSGYGFWALKTENRPDVDIIDALNYDAFLHRLIEDFDEVYECGGKLVISYKKNIEGVERNIAIGSYITSLSRIKIWSLMDDIDKVGGRTIYCDTDSVITDTKIEHFPDLVEKYMWDGCGVALGSLKNEIKDAVKKDCKKNNIPLQSKDNIDLGFFAGLKSYRYYLKYSYDGKDYNISDSKLKGYKQRGEFTEPTDNVRKLENEDYLNLLKGSVLVQRVSQFSSNKKCKQQEWQKITSIEKCFKYSYNKGIVDELTGLITPFLLPRDNNYIATFEDDELY